MDSENLIKLTEDQWRAVDKLSELLAVSSNLHDALEIGLGILLEILGRPGAALYLPRFCEHVTQDWTFYNIPEAWQPGLIGQSGPLQAKVIQALKTGQIQPGNIDQDFGAIIPLTTSTAAVGVLLVAGEPLPADEYPIWQALLRPFTRAVIQHSRLSGNTAGKPSYLELLGSRNTLRIMFDSLPISIYIIDEGYNLVAINKSRADRVGETPKQLVGRKCYEKLYDRSSPCPGCRVSETFATGQNTVRISRSWLDTDKFIEWEISTFPIFNEHNHVHQVIVVEQDVTEKRNLEANLIQSEKLAAVGQLAAGVAHEINNPLTAVIANAQILVREMSNDPTADPDVLDSIKLIEMAGTRASQVVRNLLGIARKEKYEYEPVDINDTIHNALSLAQHKLVGRPIKVSLDLAANIPPVVASQDQLQGIWINLVLNAIDAIDKDPGIISITSVYTNGEIQVTVLDNGKGIPSDHIPRLFEPFFTTKTPGRGTGLGLSVCMRSVKQNGGNIQVESQLGEWTQFTVSLPVNKGL